MTAAGAVAVGGSAHPSAQSRSAAVVTGRRFKGWVSRGTGPARTTLEELTLRPISGRQVLVRTEATNLCYSNTGAVLGLGPGGGGFGRLGEMALVQGHGGDGVVRSEEHTTEAQSTGKLLCR